MRGAIAHLKNAKVTGYQTYDEIFGLLKSGDIDAFALSRDQLNAMAKKIPGTRGSGRNLQADHDRRRSAAQSSPGTGLRHQVHDRGEHQTACCAALDDSNGLKDTPIRTK